MPNLFGDKDIPGFLKDMVESESFGLIMVQFWQEIRYKRIRNYIDGI